MTREERRAAVRRGAESALRDVAIVMRAEQRVKDAGAIVVEAEGTKREETDRRNAEQLGRALRRAADEHGAPNTFAFGELAIYGAPTPFVAGQAWARFPDVVARTAGLTVRRCDKDRRLVVEPLQLPAFDPFPKVCTCCGMTITDLGMWRRMRLDGVWEGELELRRCLCGSTLGINIDRDGNPIDPDR